MAFKEVRIDVDGMSCGHCVKTVRGALEAFKGIDIVDVEIGFESIAGPAEKPFPIARLTPMSTERDNLA